MKRFYLSLILILSLLPASSLAQKNSAAAKPAPAVKPRAKSVYGIPITTKTLANGMEIIVLPDASVPLVTVELAVRNGSFTEPPEYNGLSHLYEHMFFKPNQAFKILQCEYLQNRNPIIFRQIGCDDALKLKSEIKDVSYLETMDQIGEVHNAETREEVVNFYYSTTKPYVMTAMRNIKDAVRYPIFDEEEFAGEREAVLAELDRNLSQPGYYLMQALNDKLFYKYPTRKNIGGTKETVAKATTAQMRTIQARYYVPNNSALVITGDVNPAEVIAMAEQLFGDWKRAPDPFKEFPLVEHPPLPKSEAAIINQPVQNVSIVLGWQGPSIGKDNASTYAADVFSYILAQPDSRFQRKLVDTGLTASAGMNYYTQRNVGPIRIDLVTDAAQAKDAVKAAYAEIALFTRPDYFTDEELENAKTILEAQDLYSREKLSDYAHTLSFWWSTTGIDYFRDYHKNLRAITRADINRYLKTYVQGKPHVGLALVSPEQQAIAKLTPEDLIGGNQ